MKTFEHVWGAATISDQEGSGD